MRYVVKQLGTLLSAVSATALVAARTTAAQKCSGASRFRWTASLAYDAATALTVEIYTSMNEGASWGLVQSQAVSSGLATLSDYQQSKAANGANVAVDGWVDCLGATHVKAILGATGGGADDTLTFVATLAEVK